MCICICHYNFSYFFCLLDTGQQKWPVLLIQVMFTRTDPQMGRRDASTVNMACASLAKDQNFVPST